MANKTKKTSAKKTVAKKTPVKTAAARKPVRRVAPVVEHVEQTHECGCCHHCGCHCGCGHRFLAICIKLIILCMVFCLGCVASPWFTRDHGKKMMRHIAFDDNGCVILESVKCPKLLETLATADENSDGCISRVELKNAKRELRNARADAGSDNEQ